MNSHLTNSSAPSRPVILLATSLAMATTALDSTLQVRMLIDPGSELSFVSENILKQLQLTRRHSVIPLTGIGGTQSGSTRGVAVIIIHWALDADQPLHITAHVLKQLTTWLPTFSVPNRWWPHLQGLQLADPNCLRPGPIDIILGADTYGQFIKPEIIEGDPHEPIAQRTLFGWIILGPIDVVPSPSTATLYTVSVDHDLQELLSKFWLQEEVSMTPANLFTPEESECETNFVSPHSRDASGRYTVGLPLRASASLLGDSRPTAERSMRYLIRRLSMDTHYSHLYSSFLQEYSDQAHAVPVPALAFESAAVYYLPHHSVIKEQSLTTKLRVVFNGSSPSSSGFSLNDILHTGAKLQIDIADVLLWVRRHRYIFATDITQMFRKLMSTQRIGTFSVFFGWIKQTYSHYRLTTVTYGTRSAPFLAIRVLLQLVEDEGSRYPLAIPPLLKGQYVDDIYSGSIDLLPIN